MTKLTVGIVTHVAPYIILKSLAPIKYILCWVTWCSGVVTLVEPEPEPLLWHWCDYGASISSVDQCPDGDTEDDHPTVHSGKVLGVIIIS